MGAHTRGERDSAADAVLTAAVRRAQQGDEAAFSAVYRRVQPVVLGYLRGIAGDDAEDVASDTWLVLTRDLTAFSGDASDFRGWAVTVARRRAIDQLRRNQRQPPRTYYGVQELVDLPAPGDTEREALETLATETAVGLIAALPQEQAEAVLLRVVAGLDAQAVGRILGKRPGAVRTAAHRGLRQLARVVAQPAERGV